MKCTSDATRLARGTGWRQERNGYLLVLGEMLGGARLWEEKEKQRDTKGKQNIDPCSLQNAVRQRRGRQNINAKCLFMVAKINTEKVNSRNARYGFYFFHLILIFDNYLLLLADTDKISDNFTFFILKSFSQWKQFGSLLSALCIGYNFIGQ